MTAPQSPLAWLLAALPAHVAPDALAPLLDAYRANKRAYERQVKIRAAERTIKTIQYRNDPRDHAKLARWHAKLDKLKGEE
jgi:hypothetical protein